MRDDDVATKIAAAERLLETERLKSVIARPESAEEFDLVASWWEREAARGNATADLSAWYARSCRVAAERRRRDGRVQPWTTGYDEVAPRALPAGKGADE